MIRYQVQQDLLDSDDPARQWAGREIERLLAIVDRLPTNDDGDPVIPGDRQYDSSGAELHVQAIRWHGEWEIFTDSPRDGTLHSTREAAQKARK